MRFQKIGLIGCGNMGSALAAAMQKGRPPYLPVKSNRRQGGSSGRKIGATVSNNAEIANSVI